MIPPRSEYAYRYRQLAAKKAFKVRNEFEEHRAVFEAVVGGRLEDAQGLLAAHYRSTANIITDVDLV